MAGWQVQPGWFEDREVLAVRVAADAPPRYFISLGWRDGQVVAIRDFRYVPYIAQDSAFALDAAA